MKLERRYVEKPWGRTELPPMFDPPAGERIGEVWFTDGAELPLLAKYIFTSERLSIQVHPDDAQAHARGLPAGKSECWYILDAEPGATLGLGPEARDRQRRAARSGARRLDRAADGLAAGRGRRFHLRSVGHNPRDRRGHFAARIPAECGRDLSPLRLRPAARTSSRRRYRGRGCKAIRRSSASSTFRARRSALWSTGRISPLC